MMARLIFFVLLLNFLAYSFVVNFTEYPAQSIAIAVAGSFVAISSVSVLISDVRKTNSDQKW